MSDFGMQTFIKGTSFDVLNSMDFNYVLDVFTVTSGSGSRTYPNFPGGTIAAFTILAGNAESGSRSFTYNQSGKTFNWSINHTADIVVICSPAANTQPSGEVGFSAYKNNRVVLAPNFTPLVLTQVINPGLGIRTVQTNVPYGMRFTAFHRGLGSSGMAMDNILWRVINQNGFYALQFHTAENARACRIYVFANHMVNIPNYGFFMYRDNQIVYHGNCLPLNIKIHDTNQSSGVTSSSPMAISNGLSAFISAVVGATQVINVVQANSAGWNGSTWSATSLTIQTDITGGSSPGQSWNNRYFAYIDTAIYDQYYVQALGL